MTRINVVPPTELCDQHLLAEHRELTRIPNTVLRGKFNLDGQPDDYKLGTGHVKFFFDKMTFLRNRYLTLHGECLRRGFNVTNRWPESRFPEELCQNYSPTEAALLANRARITERMPAKARFTGKEL